MIKFREISIFTIGAAIGVGASAMFFKKKYEGFANEEITSVKETYNKRFKEAISKGNDWRISDEELARREAGIEEETYNEDADYYEKLRIEEEQSNRPVGGGSEYDGDPIIIKKEPFTKSIEDINKDKQEQALSRRTKKKDIIDYTKMAGKYKNEAEMIHDVNGTFDTDNKRDEAEYDYNNPSEEEEIMNQSPNMDISAPELITVQSFVDEYPEHEKLTLNYYTIDEVLVDEDDMPVENVELVVGCDALNSFGIFGAEENLVYVRNTRFGIDYEVIKLEERYAAY